MSFRAFIFTLALLPINSLSAQTAGQVDICKGDGMFAGIFMTHRQMGGDDLSSMMRKFGEQAGLREMILQAYGYPIMLTPETKKLAVSEFENNWTLKCFRDGPALPRKTAKSE